MKLFDDLSIMQRVGLLHQVSQLLLLESVPELELTAVNEATLAAVINNIAQQIWFEFGDQESTD